MPHRHCGGRRPRGALRRTDQPRELYGQHLQGEDRQPRAGHPGGFRRLLGRPQRFPPRVGRRAAVFPSPLDGRRRDRVAAPGTERDANPSGIGIAARGPRHGVAIADAVATRGDRDGPRTRQSAAAISQPAPHRGSAARSRSGSRTASRPRAGSRTTRPLDPGSSGSIRIAPAVRGGARRAAGDLPEPPARPVEPEPAPPYHVEDLLTGAPNRPSKRPGPRPSNSAGIRRSAGGDRPSRRERPSATREGESRHEKPETPPDPRFRAGAVLRSDLPPSRTQRSRPAPERPRPTEPETSEYGRHRVSPAFPTEQEPLERTEPEISETEIESFGAREPRKGRGRGRAPQAPGRGRPGPSAARAEPSFPEIEHDLGGEPPRPEPEFEDIPTFDEPPRRRGGRGHPARAGDWDRSRETPASPLPEVERPSEPARRRPQEAAGPPRDREPERDRPREPERDRPREPERDRPREPERDRPREPERDRERPRPHARAGEPGYIPRRERLRSSDSPFGEDLFPTESEWPERDIEPLLEDDAGGPGRRPPGSG